jgi:hypothetical protein
MTQTDDLYITIESAHPDYIPNRVDYETAKELFSVIICDDAKAVVSQGADDSGYLWWTDFVANEWLEHYPTVSLAIARLALLQECGESAWEKGFTHTPREFVNEYSKFAEVAV